MCDMCNGMTRKEIQARTTQRIRDYGREVVFVEPDSQSESFAYTVGLSRVGHPEFMVRGLDLADSMQMLNGFAASVLESNEIFAHAHTSRWKDGRLLYFSKVTSGIRVTATAAYERYGEGTALLEILFVGDDIPYACLFVRNN